MCKSEQIESGRWEVEQKAGDLLSAIQGGALSLLTPSLLSSHVTSSFLFSPTKVCLVF